MCGVNSFRICGIDPGINFTGVSLIDVDIENLNIININTFTLTPDLEKEDTEFRLLHGNRIEKILSQQQQLKYLLKCNKPNVVCCERPFFNPKRPYAFEALAELVFSFKIVMLKYNVLMEFKMFDPSSIKIGIGASYKSKKEEVREKILIIPEIKDRCEEELDKLNEHCIDAIAVSYLQLLLIRKTRSGG